jgi:hypothetical protein
MPVREAGGVFEIGGGMMPAGIGLRVIVVHSRDWNCGDTCIKKLVLGVELRCFNHKVLP